MASYTHVSCERLNIGQVVLMLISSVYQHRTHHGPDTESAALDTLYSLLYLLHHTGDKDHYLLSSEVEGRHYSS